ncbi:MAG TPA: hypothetical protein VLS27_00205 [Gammaproteobacteria bacterium]|nr:hypothetical protein [Gammaproteobacteria bacterium]
MNDEQALKEIITRYGTMADLARALECDRALVHRWVHKFKGVPVYWIERVEAKTGIPRERVRPSFFRRDV